MKKHSYIFLTMATLLCGCASDDYVGMDLPKDGEVAITFSSSEGAVTRADKTGADAAADLNNNFIVFGTKTVDGNRQTVFDHYSVNYKDGSALSTLSNYAGWEYVGQARPTTLDGTLTASTQTIKYWDFAASQYDFVAFSRGKGVPVGTGSGSSATYAKFSVVNPDNIGTDASATDLPPIYTVKGTNSEISSAYFSDLVTVENSSFATKPVTPRFRHFGAKVRVGLYETIPGYSVKDVKFYDSDDALASKLQSTTLFASSDIFPQLGSSGELRIAYTDAKQMVMKYVGESTNPAPLSYMGFGNLEYNADAANKESEANTVKYLGRTSDEATYAGGTTPADAYLTILPQAYQNVLPLNLKCDYTLVPTDGAGERIYVHGATAQVPAAYTQWQSNHAYTYLFKISDQTNGKPNPDADPVGLYPLSFDAVVVGDGDVQETVTTLNEKYPITTYQKGTPILDNTESGSENLYNSGNIYVVVGNGETLVTSGANQNVFLYEVALTPASGQTAVLSEENVADCLGGTATTTDTKTGANLTLTPISDKLTAKTTIVADDSPYGTAINVKCAVFNANKNKKYAIQYRYKENETDADYKYTYKVLSTGEQALLYYINYTAKSDDIWETTYGGLDKTLSWDLDTWKGQFDTKYEKNNITAENINEMFGPNVHLVKDKCEFDPITGQGRLAFDAPVTKIQYAFYYCNNLISIVIPETVTEIGMDAFSHCYSLISMTLPYGVTKIKEFAFDDCSNLKLLNCPSTLQDIGANAFQYCGFETIKLNEGLKSIGSSAFTHTYISEIEIPSTVETIDANAFDSSYRLEKVILPKRVGNIGASAFASIASLKTVVCNDKSSLPDDFNATIGNNAFSASSAYALESVEIPENVNVINETAFNGQYSLVSLKCYPTVPPTLSSAFTSINALDVKVPKDTYDSYQSVWDGKLPSGSTITEW